MVGLRNGIAEWSDALTSEQRVATGTELAYGVLGLLAGVGLLLRRPWTRAVLMAWAVAITATSGLAPMVWGGAGLGAGLAAGGGTALIAGGVVWLSRRGLMG